jgi:hypothetical protein
MTDTPATETTETAATSRRGPSRMLAVLAATVLIAGGIAFVAGRSNNDGASLPKLALIAGSGSSAAGTANGAQSSLVVNARFHYVVDGTLPNLPTEAKVSKLVGPPVDANTVAAWAKTLQVDGPTKAVTTGPAHGWAVTGTTGVLSVAENPGTWFLGFQAGEPGGVSGSSPGAGSGSGSGSLSTDGQPSSVAPTDRPQDLPSDADARRIGEQTLRELGVLDGDWEYEVRDGGSVGVAVSCAAGQTCTDVPSESFVVSRALVAHRVIDGHRADGLEWTVDIGDHSVIDNVSGTLTNVEAVGNYPLRPISAAIDGIRNGTGYRGPVPMNAAGPGSVAIGAPECGPAVDCAAPIPICADPCPVQDITITITNVALGTQLWMGGDPANPISYLVPTYHFTGHDESGAPWSTDVLALGDDALATPKPSAPVPSSPGPNKPGTVEPQPAGPAASEEPPGPRVSIGESVPMRFDLNFHCGVSEARFNSRWWDAVVPWPGSGGGSPQVDDLDGPLTLDDANHAHWTNGSGVRLEFVPHAGPHTAHGCD